MSEMCSKSGRRDFLTTDNTELFDRHAAIFFGEGGEVAANFSDTLQSHSLSYC
jgi:hypothetical protein